MKNYYWSAKGLVFFPIDDKEKYEKAGFDLSDVVEVDESVFVEYGCNQPAGKQRGVNLDGLPIWVDAASQTQEQSMFTVNGMKSDLLAQATIAIAPLQDAVDLDEATDAEIAALKSWKQYRIAINRIDVSSAPDITWPKAPN